MNVQYNVLSHSLLSLVEAQRVGHGDQCSDWRVERRALQVLARRHPRRNVRVQGHAGAENGATPPFKTSSVITFRFNK